MLTFELGPTVATWRLDVYHIDNLHRAVNRLYHCLSLIIEQTVKSFGHLLTTVRISIGASPNQQAKTTCFPQASSSGDSSRI